MSGRIRIAAMVTAVVIVASGSAVLLLRVRVERPVPSVRVVRGDLAMAVLARGEVRAAKAVAIVVPPAPGPLQIVAMAPSGTSVNAGDVVAEFDPAEQQSALEEARIRLEESVQETRKARAEAELQSAQDRVALLEARFAVRRAELEVSRKELVSAIDAQRSEFELEESRRRLTQLEADLGTRAVSSDAGLAIFAARQAKASLDISQGEELIAQMKRRSPIEGVLSVKENRDAGGAQGPGVTVPEYHARDTVAPGRALAEVLDLKRIEMAVELDESDAADIALGQVVEVRPDALPHRVLQGTVTSVAGVATRDRPQALSGAPRFRILIALAETSERLMPGMTADVSIRGGTLSSVLLLPRQAIFERDGKFVVFLRRRGTVETREVTVTRRGSTQVAVEGLDEGDHVALVDPERRRDQPLRAPETLLPGTAAGRGTESSPRQQPSLPSERDTRGRR